MITVISGTNKSDSLTRVVSSIYYNRLRSIYPTTRYLSLEDIRFDFITGSMYSDHSESIKMLQHTIFNPTKKFVFILPEYNGSIPGVLKLLIDALEVRPAFQDKKAALTGIATGKAGNIRGLDHMASILQHMRVTVMPQMLPISRVKDELSLHGDFILPGTIKTIENHLKSIIDF